MVRLAISLPKILEIQTDFVLCDGVLASIPSDPEIKTGKFLCAWRLSKSLFKYPGVKKVVVEQNRFWIMMGSAHDWNILLNNLPRTLVRAFVLKDSEVRVYVFSQY